MPASHVPVPPIPAPHDVQTSADGVVEYHSVAVPAPSSSLGNAAELSQGFSVDAEGHLIRNEQARLELEKLHALNTPEELERKLQDLEQSLPPAAARDVRELMEQYVNYQEAQRQTFPPGHEPASADEVLNQIDGLHALRVQYFGAEAAEALYGSEERVQRELARLMSLAKDDSLTLQERAELAQALYSQMTETAAVTQRAQQADAPQP